MPSSDDFILFLLVLSVWVFIPMFMYYLCVGPIPKWTVVIEEYVVIKTDYKKN